MSSDKKPRYKWKMIVFYTIALSVCGFVFGFSLYKMVSGLW